MLLGKGSAAVRTLEAGSQPGLTGVHHAEAIAVVETDGVAA